MYAEIADFKKMYPDIGLDDKQIAAALEAASRDADGFTYNRIRAVGIDQLSDFQKETVKAAVCEQAKFRIAYADMLESPLTSYSINGVSMQFGGVNIISRGGVMTTVHVAGLLRQTGLCYTGLNRRFM